MSEPRDRWLGVAAHEHQAPNLRPDTIRARLFLSVSTYSSPPPVWLDDSPGKEKTAHCYRACAALPN
jgi:hypothetical protein